MISGNNYLWAWKLERNETLHIHVQHVKLLQRVQYRSHRRRRSSWMQQKVGSTRHNVARHDGQLVTAVTSWRVDRVRSWLVPIVAMVRPSQLTLVFGWASCSAVMMCALCSPAGAAVVWQSARSDAGSGRQSHEDDPLSERRRAEADLGRLSRHQVHRRVGHHSQRVRRKTIGFSCWEHTRAVLEVHCWFRFSFDLGSIFVWLLNPSSSRPLTDHFSNIVANREFSTGCYLFTVSNSGLLSVQRPARHRHCFRHWHIPELISGVHSSSDFAVFPVLFAFVVLGLVSSVLSQGIGGE